MSRKILQRFMNICQLRSFKKRPIRWHREISKAREHKSRCYGTRPSPDRPLDSASIWSPWTAGATSIFWVSVAALYLYFKDESSNSYTHSTSQENSRLTKSTLEASDVPKLSHDISPKNISDARAEFIALLGEKGINEKKGDLIAHSSTEWSEAPNPSDHAALIVYPNTTEEVSQIARICHRRRIPMTAFSGGTSLEGALASTHGGICIDFRNMNKVIALHQRDMDVVVQPGVDWQMLNEQLEKEGLFFPVDPGPGACIGGMISTSCSGTNAYRYGTMKDWVISVTVVLADGTIIKTRGRPRKSSAGYDLTKLFVGASGTLGLVTEAVLKITSKPENVHVAVASFPDCQKAVNTAVRLVQNEVNVAAMELLDEVFVKAVNESGYVDRPLIETPSIIFKFSGSTLPAVKEQISLVKRFSDEEDSIAFEVSETPEEVESLWAARKTALWSFLALKDNPDDRFVSSDVAVPISRLADIIEKVKKKTDVIGLKSATLGHVGDGKEFNALEDEGLTSQGNFHSAILFSSKDKDLAEKTILEIQQLGIEMEGTIAGEHGVGLSFRDALENELGRDTIATMRQIKIALDPLGLLNYGKIFHMGSKESSRQ